MYAGQNVFITAMFKKPRQVLIFILLLGFLCGAMSLPENYHLKKTIFGITIDRIISPPSLDFSIFGINVKKEFALRI